MLSRAVEKLQTAGFHQSVAFRAAGTAPWPTHRKTNAFGPGDAQALARLLRCVVGGTAETRHWGFSASRDEQIDVARILLVRTRDGDVVRRLALILERHSRAGTMISLRPMSPRRSACFLLCLAGSSPTSSTGKRHPSSRASRRVQPGRRVSLWPGRRQPSASHAEWYSPGNRKSMPNGECSPASRLKLPSGCGKSFCMSTMISAERRMSGPLFPRHLNRGKTMLIAGFGVGD